MESRITRENFHKICRTCLKDNTNLIHITLFNIIDMIKACSSIQIYPNDDLPNKLCDLCFAQLKNAYNFKYLCEKSDKELKEYIFNETENKHLIDRVNHLSVKSQNLIQNEIKIEFSHCEKECAHIVNDYQHSEVLKEETAFSSDSEKQNNNYGVTKNVHKNAASKKKIKKIEVKKKLLMKIGKRLQCDICKHKVNETWQLGLHMKRVHNAEGAKCSRCSLICYHKLHLEEHERSHFEKRAICDICNKGFVTQARLRKHQVSHSVERPYQCPQCDWSFKFRFLLTKHIKVMHVNATTYEICQVCGKNVRNLKHHMKIHGKRSTYTCHECSKKFSLEKSLEIHFKRVHQNEALKYTELCNVCGRGVVSRAELKRHMLSHTGEKPFACDKCDKKFSRTGGLNFHIKTVHLNQRPCVCPVCSQAFHSKNILSNHMRKHTGERPYTCLVCSKSFGFKGVLKTHMKVHSS